MIVKDELRVVVGQPRPVVVASPDSDEDLRQYRATVQKLAESKSAEIFLNGKPEHAAIIFQAFFTYAKDRVIIFCQNLATNVFGVRGMLSSMEAAAQKGIRIEVIVQDEPEADEFAQKLEELSKDPKLKVSFMRANDVVKSVPANFATMDGEAYRFEADRERYSAHASMFSPKLALQFEETFFRFKASILEPALA